MGNRTVFLDFDGVIATSSSYKRRYQYLWKLSHGEVRFPRGSRLKRFIESCETDDRFFELVFSPTFCANVQKLLDYTKADLVLSTSWRNVFTPEENNYFLSYNGITTVPVGQTPSRGIDMYNRGRGWEIHHYCLIHNLTPKDIIILEDEEDCKPYNGRMIRTSFYGPHSGFTEKHLKRALKLF